jgi:hypothetical protein
MFVDKIFLKRNLTNVFINLVFQKSFSFCWLCRRVRFKYLFLNFLYKILFVLFVKIISLQKFAKVFREHLSTTF